MFQDYKPERYSTISPYLIVSDAVATITFLEHVLGGTELQRFTNDDGSIMHAEVRLEDSVVMIADRAEGWPAVAAHVHVYVPDVDATYARALAAGAEAIQAPVRKDDADKRGGVKDAGGTTWWIATRGE